jgi:hypothetical protein
MPSADIHKRNAYGETPVGLASKEDHREVVALLVGEFETENVKSEGDEIATVGDPGIERIL